MRKKSHISLAKYLITNLKVDDLIEHKKSFYIGSILPDLKPSFFTRRHNIEETFEILIEEIKKITIYYDMKQGINSYYARHLGVITHYLADYCTFPHNSIFPGSIKEHIFYEKKLKFSLKEYIEERASQRERNRKQTFHTIEDILNIIRKTHTDYLNALKNIKVDIQYIVDLCFRVVDAILHFFEYSYERIMALKYGQSLQTGYLQI
jgi:hypothetical protein